MADARFDEAMQHLGNVLYTLSDLHPDDRCEALERALAFYNAACPNCQVAPSGLPFQRLTTLGDHLGEMLSTK